MLSLIVLTLLLVLNVEAATLWCKPDGQLGNGSGDSKANAANGCGSSIQNRLNPGDTLKIVNGLYHEPFTIRQSGTANNYIRYEAETMGDVTFDMRQRHSSAINILNKEWVILDGVRAGDTSSWAFHMLNNNDIIVRRCGCWNGGSTPAACNANYGDCDHNSHCFEFAFSQRVLGEDLWAWGAWRYGAVLYQTSDSTLRRIAVKGGPWGSLPHGGVTSYCNVRSNIENAIVFDITRTPRAPQGGPFNHVHSGFVSDAHDCGPYTPAHQNVLHGVISIGNGVSRSQRADSAPYQFLIMSENGWDTFEDVISWAEEGQGGFQVSLRANSNPRSYWNGPTRFIQRHGRWNVCNGGSNCPPKDQTINTGNVRLQNRYVDKVYTDEPLWPWPYEDIIERDFQLGMSLTDFVQSKLGSTYTLMRAPSAAQTPAPTPAPQTPAPTPDNQTPAPTPDNQTPQPTPNQTPQPTPVGATDAPTPVPTPETTRNLADLTGSDTVTIQFTYKPASCEVGSLLCFCTPQKECMDGLYCEVNGVVSEDGLCLKKMEADAPVCIGEQGCQCATNGRCFSGLVCTSINEKLLCVKEPAAPTETTTAASKATLGTTLIVTTMFAMMN